MITTINLRRRLRAFLVGRGAALGDDAILAAMARGDVVIDPMAPGAVGSNSVDVHLALPLAVYEPGELRTDRACPVRRFDIDREAGTLLLPDELYLGATVERVEAGPYLPMLDGTSGAGRLGLGAHVAAGVGDVGFVGHWTLEIVVVRPTRIFGGEPIGQLLFYEVTGPVRCRYDRKPGAGYAGQGPRPEPSRMWTKPRWLGR